MKIRIDIETTPQEMRTFLGLPDVEPIQHELLERVRRNMDAGMAGFDPSTLLAPFLPSNLQSLEALQKRFWQAAGNRSSKKSKESGK